MPPGNPINSDSDLESVISTQDRQLKPRRNSTGPKYYCTIEECRAVFKRLDHLDRHEYKHTGLKKHACTYDGCGKSYSILTHLKRHLRTTHERLEKPTKTVPCRIDYCDKMFQTINSMKRHLREVHENPKVFHCAHCGEKFTQRLKMRRHVIVKHTKEYPHNCEKCHKGFHQEFQYNRHVAICKIYPCNDCTLQFDKWSTYIKHCKETQHGRKFYKCEYCARVFSKPGELQKHVVIKHLDDKLKMVYKCSHEGCTRQYDYERNLKQHQRTAHAGKRFECMRADCTRAFISAQNLQKHLERDHVDGGKKSASKIVTGVRKQRKKRKDAGQSVMSNLAKLSGVAVDKKLDKLLREREEAALNVVSAALAESPNIEEEEMSAVVNFEAEEVQNGASEQQPDKKQQGKNKQDQELQSDEEKLCSGMEVRDGIAHEADEEQVSVIEFQAVKELDKLQTAEELQGEEELQELFTVAELLVEKILQTDEEMHCEDEIHDGEERAYGYEVSKVVNLPVKEPLGEVELPDEEEQHDYLVAKDQLQVAMSHPMKNRVEYETDRTLKTNNTILAGDILLDELLSPAFGDSLC